MKKDSTSTPPAASSGSEPNRKCSPDRKIPHLKNFHEAETAIGKRTPLTITWKTGELVAPVALRLVAARSASRATQSRFMVPMHAKN
jgi:hypothetical protein